MRFHKYVNRPSRKDDLEIFLEVRLLWNSLLSARLTPFLGLLAPPGSFLTFSLPLRLISALRAAEDVFFFTCTAAGAGAAEDDTDLDLPAKRRLVQ